MNYRRYSNDMCPYDAREWNPGKYEWRTVGDHADPEEGLATVVDFAFMI